MLVRAPLVDAEQDRAVRIQDLTEVVMARSRFVLAEQRLVPLEARRDVAYADDRPDPFHGSSPPNGRMLRRTGGVGPWPRPRGWADGVPDETGVRSRDESIPHPATPAGDPTAARRFRAARFSLIAARCLSRH